MPCWIAPSCVGHSSKNIWSTFGRPLWEDQWSPYRLPSDPMKVCFPVVRPCSRWILIGRWRGAGTSHVVVALCRAQCEPEKKHCLYCIPHRGNQAGQRLTLSTPLPHWLARPHISASRSSATDSTVLRLHQCVKQGEILSRIKGLRSERWFKLFPAPEKT